MILRNTDLSLILYFSGFQPWLTFHFCERIKKQKKVIMPIHQDPKTIKSEGPVSETPPPVLSQAFWGIRG